MQKFGRSLLVTAALGAMTVMAQAQSFMTHHVRDVVRNGQVQANGSLPQNQTMSLDLVLPVRNQAALDQFVADVYNPASANYHHFLTPQQFTAQFGPSQADYDAVVQFAKMHGFTVTGGSRDGMDVQVSGSVANVESAFHVHMQTYKHPTENRNFFSADQEPTTDLSINLWHVTGLDNYSIPHPLLETKAAYAAAHGIDASKVVSNATTGSGPSASFLGSDMRAAYYGSGSLTGSGQNLGLLEYYGTDLADLQTYYKNVGQAYPNNVTVLSTDGTSTSCTYPSCDDTEQTLDMTQALGMAPGLASMTMYVGSSDTAILSSMTTHSPLPTTIGCSWGWTPADPSTLNPYFEKMASQGQSFFAASGDNSTWKATGKSAAWPADNAYVISVGGTDLTTSSAGGPWQSETAWSDSGGGISPDNIAIPSWQQYSGVINSSNHGSTTLRNGPDVSANANFTFYTCADQTSCLANEYGGTSFAAPMWAGYIALVNQQLAANSESPVGFLNPTIYQQNATSPSYYSANFHDVTSGTSGSYSAVTGYDLVTGWGSPTPALVSALSGSQQQQNPDFTIAANPGSLTVAPGSNGSSSISIGAVNGFTSAVTLSASNLPSGVTVGFGTNPVNGSGSSTATFTVASGTAAGTYSITITGTSGSLSHSTTVTLTVSGTQQSSFTISASPNSLTISRGSSGSVTITLAGTTTGAVTFSASGQGSGQTVSFSPSSLSGAGSTTMKITVSRNASRTTRTVTVKASGGGTSATTTVSLTIH
ncbi:MAG TPA: protease pro-enzyme activation domain-containing protein [Acidobacteriaceae bacterium]|nr:protease pro-enzyme activation domain-containing protein [Acidobacteriaceae bacterium]